MIMLTLGIPPGFEVLTEDLDAYLASKVLSKFELTGKQLTLYISEIAASQSLALQYRLRATMPVTASDGGGNVYPYYEPDRKSETEPTTFEVTQ